MIGVDNDVEWSVVASGLRQTQAAETGTEQQHNVNVTVNDSVNKPS